MNAMGKQVTLDLYHCAENLLQDKQALKDIIQKAMSAGDMSALVDYMHSDTHTDFSIVALCVGGHVTAHSYPRLGFIAVDIFSCDNNTNPDKVALIIKNFFNPESSKMTYLQRGDFGTISDMKPRKQTHTQTMRRVKNTGAKMLRLLSNKDD